LTLFVLISRFFTVLMPWNNVSAIQERTRFALAALQKSQSLAALCRRFRISRQCGYKWLQRFRLEGRAGMEYRSRRPLHCPRQTSPHWLKALRQLRQRFPHWGAKKIHARLRRSHPRARLPAVRTLTKWLRRLGPVRRQRHTRRGPPLILPPLTQPRRPNEVWTVDFKGSFRTLNGTRVHPLTVRDLFSRFILVVHILPRQHQSPVRAVFIQLFQQHGLPKIIRVDNGSPFGSTGAAGLSALSRWWTTLGIHVQFIRPGHPEENGAHEQMHRELKRDTARRPEPHPPAQQHRSNRWVRYYNYARPHEALGGRCPAQLYSKSRRRYQAPRPIRYPRGWAVRQVRSNGQIKWQGRMRSIGEAFAGQPVALRRKGPQIYQVRFMHLPLGRLHNNDTGGIRPTKHYRRSM
jgi:transposase InsO family protein